MRRRRTAEVDPTAQQDSALVVEGAPVPDADVYESVRDSAESSLTGKVVGGAAWSAIGRTSSQALQFLAGLALARLLLPADFGLLASVYVVTGFAVLFFDMGLNAALVHARVLRRSDMDTAFWLNALGGIVFVGILAAVGPLVAEFYSDDRLRYITPLAGLSFAFALGTVHSALLTRRLKFKRLAVIETAAAVVGNSTTVVGALAGWGPLALVAGPALQSIVLTTLMWIASPWRPRGFIRRASVRRLWSFSGGMLGFSLVNYAGRNSDNLLIGRILGAAPLGYYNRAYNLMLLPLQQISQVVGRVMFPALASMGDDRARLQRAYRRTVTVMTAVTMPVLVGMSAVADGLVPLLWGDQWGATIPLLQVLCLAGLPQCLSSTEGWLYQSQGRTKLMFLMGGISTAIGVAAIVIGLHWGLLGVTIGILTTAWAYQPIALRVACGLIGLRGSRVILDILPTVVIALVMGGAVYGAPVLLGVPRTEPLVLCGQILLGVLVYGALMFVFRRDVLRELATLRPGRRRAGVQVAR
ncbi:MOP flippase family protein [Kineococcus sp. DHX-1]|uniref:MOP flippase family protein n=1 Tax=Kineococcus sp. DHX-1 TaxID=3349638 RepID=UPI0036D33180